MALTPVSVSRSVSNKTCHVLSAGLHLLCIYSMVKRLEDMLQWKISNFLKIRIQPWGEIHWTLLTFWCWCRIQPRRPVINIFHPFHTIRDVNLCRLSCEYLCTHVCVPLILGITDNHQLRWRWLRLMEGKWIHHDSKLQYFMAEITTEHSERHKSLLSNSMRVGLLVFFFWWEESGFHALQRPVRS